MLTFRHDEAGQVFTAWLGTEQVGSLSYRMRGRLMHLENTYTDPQVRGRGLAGKLTRHVLDHARRQGLSVVPECPYIVKFLDEHPEHSDVAVA